MLLFVGLIHAEPFEFMPELDTISFSNTNLDDPQYRLLDIVQPSHYYVDLDVYLSESRFNGLVQITVNVCINFDLKHLITFS